MKRWTPEEDLKLRELVASRPKLTAGEIAMRMDRDRNSVIGRCRRIGLALPNSGVKVNHAARSQPIEREPEPGAEPKRRRKKAAPLDGLKLGHWSDDEVAELRRLVARRPRLSAVAIADKLNREADSVRSALKKHGLSLRGNDEGKPASGPKRRRSRPQRQKSKPERQKAQQPKPKPQQPKPKPQQQRPRSQPPTRFADLAAHQCRFPVTDDRPGPDMACCGQAVVDQFAGGIRATHCAECADLMVRA